MLVSTNSTLMELFAGPGDLSVSSAVGSVPNPLEKTPLGFCRALILLYEVSNGFGHEACHGSISRGGIDAEFP